MENEDLVVSCKSQNRLSSSFQTSRQKQGIKGSNFFLAYKHKRAGYRQIHNFIRKKERVNHKRIYRLYSELGLKYRIKPKRKRLSTYGFKDCS
ncbi:hypothetical protein C5473_18630 [Leptospira interrogans serovar Weerasinghe]|nr:hypothetical protein C5473_18630 [Leptospira interrogans serovar Weerasinghe]